MARRRRETKPGPERRQGPAPRRKRADRDFVPALPPDRWDRLASGRLFFWTAVAALVAVMGGAMICSARLETATFDEPAYLAAGYSYVSLGSYRYNPEHPPLPKLLAGLALRPLAPRLPLETAAWQRGDAERGGWLFLYRNRVDPETLLFRGRLPFIGLTLAFGIILAVWTRARFGAVAALVALFLYTLDPAMVAHGRYAATDMIAAVLIFLACAAWDQYLAGGRRVFLAAAGVAAGLALGSKSSSLMLFGLLPLISVVRWWLAKRDFSLRRALAASLAVFVLAAGVLAVLYWPENVRVLEPGTPRLAHIVDPGTRVGLAFERLGKALDLPAHAWLVGLYANARTNERGHPAYLLGDLRGDGWWYYFPVVFALKTPTALLVALGAALVVALRRGPAVPGARAGDWAVLLVPPALFLFLAMQARLNLGQRYILAIYPFLYVVAGTVLAGRRARVLTLAVAALLAVEHAWVSPHYLAFFNLPSGGPGRGAEYLADCNLDWGQDLKKLRAYLDSAGPTPICLAYWGNNDPSYYGLRAPWVPSTGDRQARERMDCLAAVSVNYVLGLTIKPGTFDWLQEMEPVAKVGYSIYVYDFRKGAGAKPPSR